MPKPSVAVRLGTEGKSQVKNDFAEVATGGDAAAKRIGDAFDREAQRMDRARQNMAANAAKLAAIQPQTAVQMRINDSVGTGYAQQEGSARRSAQAFIEAAKAEEQLEARTRALMAAIDPTWAAQQRFNAELAEAKALFDAGRIGAEGYAAAQARASATLEATTGRQAREQAEATAALAQRVSMFRAEIDPAYAASLRFNSSMAEARTLISQGAISLDDYCAKLRIERAALDASAAAGQRNARVTGEARVGMQQLTMQLNDAATMWALGAKPQQIFVSQAGQVIQAVQLMTGGTSKFANFMGGPWGAAITVGTIVLIPLVTKLLEGEKAMKQMELASNGLGDAQGVLGQMFDLTTGKLKSQNEMLRLNVQLMAINLRANAMAKEASSKEAFRGADSGQNTVWDQIQGTFTGRGPKESAQIMNRAQTVQSWMRQYRSGNMSGSDFSRLVENYGTSGGFKGLNVSAEDLIQAIADDATAKASRETADKIETTLASGKLDPAFVKPDTKKPPKPKVDRHAETLARESEATESLITNLYKLGDAYAISDAAALKAEITARATEQGIKKQADVTAYVNQQMRLEVARRYADAGKAAAVLRTEVAERTKLNDAVIAGTMTAQEAQQQMQNEAQLRPYLIALALAEGDAKEKLAARIAELRVEQRGANMEASRTQGGQMLESMRQQLETVEAELRLVGMGTRERERALGILRVQQDLKRSGITAESELGQQILSTNASLQSRSELLRQQTDAWQEVQNVGENFVDTVLDPSNWDDWGEMGKRVISDLMAEMMRLAVINPLKNSLFGSALPTLGGVLGALGSPNKIGNDVAGLERNFDKVFTTGNAAGTYYFGGGRTRVGENGAEEVELPRGSRILTASQTRERGGMGGMQLNMPISIDATGADAAGLARVEQQLAALQRSLPGRIIATVNDGRQRGFVRA